MIPTREVGLEDHDSTGWHHWIGRFTHNDELPGEAGTPAGGPSIVDYVRRALRLVADFVESLAGDRASASTPASATFVAGAPLAALAGLLEASTLLPAAVSRTEFAPIVAALDRVLGTVRRALGELVAEDRDLRRTWQLVSVMAASVRGVLADGLLTHPAGFRAANGEDFLDWIIRHGAAPEVAEFAFIRGLYDLVFADQGGDRARRGVSAGIAVFMTSKMFFEYRGAIFWKMAAGMGDVVFAPMYQVLRRRGVDFEFFHRVDRLHLADDGLHLDAVTMGQQVALADRRTRYEPLVRVGDLPCFPDAPLVGQLRGAEAVLGQPLESHFCEWPDVGTHVLQRGRDFDVAILAVPVGMAAIVAQDLVAARPEWRAMVDGLATTATQSLQLWLRPDERTLGWPFAGATVSAYTQPFNTWASMDQLIAAECWPADQAPGTIAYFCGALDAPATSGRGTEFVDVQRAAVLRNARAFVEHDLGHLLPGLHGPAGVRWDMLCGEGPSGDPLAGQFVSVNVDPSDRYVLCAPGTDHLRLRADESGLDNLFLAGDWTDNGLNAGCIEAATLSGLQAANAVLGRPRNHRITGNYLG